MIAWLARIVGSVFGLKFFLGGVIMSILAIVLYNGLVGVIEETLNFAVAQISGVEYGSFTSPSISGFAGWFLAQLKLPECISVICSAVAIKFILRKIPFIKW